MSFCLKQHHPAGSCCSWHTFHARTRMAWLWQRLMSRLHHSFPSTVKQVTDVGCHLLQHLILHSLLFHWLFRISSCCSQWFKPLEVCSTGIWLWLCSIIHEDIWHDWPLHNGIGQWYWKLCCRQGRRFTHHLFHFSDDLSCHLCQQL